MFSSLGLFRNLPCPDPHNCTRGKQCVFSHNKDTILPKPLRIPLDQHKISEPSTSTSIPAKRPAIPTPPNSASRVPSKLTKSALGATSEPPRKFQKLGPGQKPLAKPTASYTPAGAPILKVNAAQSQVAVPVRQAMLKNIYDHFVVLYGQISSANPTLAADHALLQEEEVYNKSNKLTYRHSVINCIAAIKKRPPPDSASHLSVGTEAQVQVRKEQKAKLQALKLTREKLDPLVVSTEELQRWGYMLDVPPGPGGYKPSEEGGAMKCERCLSMYQVKPRDRADQCDFHWGRPYTMRADGERTKIYSCCSRPASEGGGCTSGPHVFYESKPEDLHKRHAFSFTRRRASTKDTALDVAALDCEMVYSTGGMRVARVSVVDGGGDEVFDELVRMDDGVEVIDYNTRFSGITEEAHASATETLASIRQSLDILINEDTILIGHALDNDLKTLRMIHHRCIDTALLFPHPQGPPYRKALRNLVKEYLGLTIQSGGGTVGHSSVEDSIATLDLVRWHVLNRPMPSPTKPVANGTLTTSSTSISSATSLPTSSLLLPRTSSALSPAIAPPRQVVDLTMWD